MCSSKCAKVFFHIVQFVVCSLINYVTWSCKISTLQSAIVSQCQEKHTLYNQISAAMNIISVNYFTNIDIVMVVSQLDER